MKKLRWVAAGMFALAEAVAHQTARPRWNDNSFFRRFAAYAD